MSGLGTVRTETRVIEWRAVEGPRLCYCGHEHYGWTDGWMAPQWGYCEHCPCRSLREVGLPSPPPAIPEGQEQQR